MKIVSTAELQRTISTGTVANVWYFSCINDISLHYLPLFESHRTVSEMFGEIQESSECCTPVEEKNRRGNFETKCVGKSHHPRNGYLVSS